ncbi:MAG: transglutaminase domain-containing protein [Lachnospiraceae bacterium]
MSRRRKKSTCGCFVVILLAAAVLGLAAAAWMQGWFGGVVDTMEEAEATVPFQEITISEESLAGKYYYQQLDDEDKTVYKEIAQGIKDFQEEIYIHTGEAEQGNRLFRNVLYDMPEIFWCDGQATSTAYVGNEEPYTTIKVNYTYSREESDDLKKQMEESINACLAGVSADSSEYDKIKYVFEYIVNTVEYDINAPDNQNICSVFIGKRSVCAGYARATQYLLETMGIFSTYVPGSSMNEDHAWNLVRCDGEYYYVDATWGDPVFTQQEDVPELSQEEMINYDYLCCSDAQLFKTHTLSDGITMPECISDKYNYYIMQGMYYEEYDLETFQDVLNQSVSRKDKKVIFKFSSTELYEQAKDEILGDLLEEAAQYLMSLYDLSEVRYYYQEEVQLNKLVIFWSYE